MDSNRCLSDIGGWAAVSAGVRATSALAITGPVHRTNINRGAVSFGCLYLRAKVPQFPNGIVSSVSFVSTTNTARSLAGFVLLALALTPWRSPGSSEKLCPDL